MKVQQKPTTYTNVCEISKMLLMDYTDYKQKKNQLLVQQISKGAYVIFNFKFYSLRHCQRTIIINCILNILFCKLSKVGVDV